MDSELDEPGVYSFPSVTGVSSEIENKWRERKNHSEVNISRPLLVVFLFLCSCILHVMWKELHGFWQKIKFKKRNTVIPLKESLKKGRYVLFFNLPFAKNLRSSSIF